MSELKDLVIQLESHIDIKSIYENSTEPEGYIIKISNINIEIMKIKIKIIEAINKI